jgi:hypothetical protein
MSIFIDLCNQTIQTFRARWVNFLPATLALMFYQLIQANVLLDSDGSDMMVMMITYAILGFLLQQICSLFIFTIIDIDHNKKTLHYRKAMSKVWSCYPTMIASSFVLLAGIAIVLGGAFFLFYFLFHNNTATMFAMTASAMLTLFAMMRLAFYPLTILLDKQGILSSLQATFYLSEKSFWKVLFGFAIPIVLSILFKSLFLFAAKDLPKFSYIITFSIFDTLFMMPLSHCILYKLYHHLKKINPTYIPK